MNWQDISTAPKDGTRILLCTGGGGPEYYHLATWDGEHSRPFIPNKWTHWQPLPSPPTGEPPMNYNLLAAASIHASAVGTAGGFFSGLSASGCLPQHVREAALKIDRRLAKSFDELRREIEGTRLQNHPTITQKRITAEQVTQAYRATGFKPIRETYIKCNGDTALCGLAVVAVASGELDWLNLRDDYEDDTEKFEAICNAIGLDRDYANDFVQAFDVPAIEKDTDGTRDGREAAIAVFGPDPKASVKHGG